jgi:hypothetical protein
VSVIKNSITPSYPKKLSAYSGSLQLFITIIFSQDCYGYSYANALQLLNLYRVSQEECAKLRESVPYVELYRYNPKHLYPKLNGYGDNGQRKV